ncbi:hypothetical protein B0F90DRAFT_883491 [Multifurca ochricompacta]|uniref:Uncharacterized protein n=1 Tax=Multifurca ochricompacta TaxID=376703 RepID=A0AAD4M0R7_9AGAM|nr:hypothetical protein B0F90DRAFT_883491 [Multifurca ochricompacta]
MQFQFQNSVRNRNLNLKASTISRITASPQTQATVKLPYTPCGSTGPSVTATRTRSSSSASSSPSSSSSTLAIVQVQGGPLFPITPSTNTDPETRTGTVMGSAVNDDDNDHHPTTQTKLKLNPAAPAFTPSPSPSPSPVSPASIMAMMTTTHHRVLDPTARAFAPRGGASLGDDSAPSSPADSVGPATPSPIPASVTTPIRYNTFAFSARLARVGKSGGGGGGVGSGRVGIENGKTAALHQQLPVGVGKMRVVRPEEVVIGEKRAGEVFVFF